MNEWQSTWLLPGPYSAGLFSSWLGSNSVANTTVTLSSSGSKGSSWHDQSSNCCSPAAFNPVPAAVFKEKGSLLQYSPQRRNFPGGGNAAIKFLGTLGKKNGSQWFKSGFLHYSNQNTVPERENHVNSGNNVDSAWQILAQIFPWLLRKMPKV